jgi:farnesyl-diphosphate farnesyltransferase
MSDDLLRDLLRQVSRSFYLSLAVLPASLREPIGLAYVLARTADTVADTRLIARAERLRHLEILRRAYEGAPADLAEIVKACAPEQANPAERRLLECLDESVARLARLPEADRAEVRTVLGTLTSGMIFDLTRFPGEDSRRLAALDTLAELDQYTYLVAGCVGPFWTALHVSHRPRLAGWNRASMGTRSVRFGKALQMTNVLRDVPTDLRHGRCYLPAQELARLDLEPIDLLDPARSARARPLVHRLLALGLEHYDAAWQYTLAIPRLEWRMRLACSWPLMIGMATVRELAAHPDPLAAAVPVKIRRSEVQAIVLRSLLIVASNTALAAEARRLRGKITLTTFGS